MSGFNHMPQRALWSNAKVASEDGRSRLIYDLAKLKGNSTAHHIALYLPAQLILESSPKENYDQLSPLLHAAPGCL